MTESLTAGASLRDPYLDRCVLQEVAHSGVCSSVYDMRVAGASAQWSQALFSGPQDRYVTPEQQRE
jgi:hypothetical protein